MLKFAFPKIAWFKPPQLADEKTTRVFILGLVFFVIAGLYAFNVLKRFEYVTYDYRFMLKGARPAHPDIVVIEISDDSIAKIGRWPWGRDWHASMVRILKSLGAKAVIFDVIFSETSEPEKDAALAGSLKEAGNVYLAEIIEKSSAHPKGLLLTSLPEILQAQRGGGHINLRPDVDGVMRRIPLLEETETGRVPQLSLAAALDFWNVDLEKIVETKHALEIPRGDRTLRVPLDGNANRTTSRGETLASLGPYRTPSRGDTLAFPMMLVIPDPVRRGGIRILKPRG